MQIIGVVLIPIAAVLISNSFNKGLTEKEIQLKYLELAIGILREKPDPELKAKALRSWAVDILQLHSPIKLSDDALLELKTIGHKVPAPLVAKISTTSPGDDAPLTVTFDGSASYLGWGFGDGEKSKKTDKEDQ